MPNTLYYGDNLRILREHVKDGSVDLIYLDPPFNSSRTYNLLFRQVKGESSPAQIMAFEDAWTWSPALYQEFMADATNVKLFDLMESLYRILGRSEMMAYLLMMAPRLLELHRTLKTTGSLYLHCDPVASHYLKIILDVVFGPVNFRNEITWKRTSAHNDTAQGRRAYGNVTDTILYYTRSSEYTFNPQYTPYNADYEAQFYRHVDSDGRRYRLSDMTGPGGAAKGNPEYEVMGVRRYWRFSEIKMRELAERGRVVQTAPGNVPQQKRYLDEMPGVALQNLWNDINPIQPHARERRGYPTQKPLALLERIVRASSDEGNVVMDPFAGCGTAVIAAERLGRQWIGIDITYLAIAEVVYRLATEDVAGRTAIYAVVGSPTDAYSARKFFEQTAPQNHKPFEMWCISLVQGEPIEKKGGDRGIDGRIPIFDPNGKLNWAVIQVKGGHLTPGLIRDFGHVIAREKALFGLFLSLDEPTKQMRQEAEELGIVEGYGARRIPRMQLFSVRSLLEEKKRPELPEGYMPLRNQGVGQAQPRQEALEV